LAVVMAVATRVMLRVSREPRTVRRWTGMAVAFMVMPPGRKGGAAGESGGGSPAVEGGLLSGQ